jgi:hypothetical protein
MKRTFLWYHWSDLINEYKDQKLGDIFNEIEDALNCIQISNFEKLALEVNGNQLRVRDLDMEGTETPWFKVSSAVNRLRICTARKNKLVSHLGYQETDIALTVMGCDPFHYWTKKSLVRAISESDYATWFDGNMVNNIITKILLTDVS